jgi:acyl-CoA synthetase (AMP-forming)/AMP-acid ligase II
MRGDERWRTIGGLVRDAATRFGPREAVVDCDTRLSFSALAASVDQAARAVIASGIERGDRVSIWAPNSWEWIVAALGVLTAGGVLVPINTRFKQNEAAYIIEKAGSKLVFTTSDFLGTDYTKLVGNAIDLMRWSDFTERAEEISLAELEQRVQSIVPHDLSDIMFTSGTTGKPKGVMTTHAQTLRVFDVWADVVGLTEDDRYLIVNPFFHTFGYKAGFIACLMRGATIVPHAVFDVPQVLEKVRAERISVLPGPPTLYQSILNTPDRGDLSSLRLAVTGAAVVPVELIKRMRDELTFETILTAYGLTESSGVVTMCRQDDDPETIANTSGRAIPDVEVRVTGDGEIVVRGYNVMQGYFQDPEATAEAIDADGWLHTGDIGVMDERGYVRITDRLKDMFIVGGFNAYPAEIENELLAHPSVAQVAVVGMPDERLGEVGCAFVVPRAGQAVDADELIAWSKQRLANYKVPRRIEVVEALPLNASGKVLKFELRERAKAL